MLEKSVVAEIEVIDFWGRKIRVSKTGSDERPSRAPNLASQEATTEAVKSAEPKNAGLATIRSPIVGTFYRAPAPDAPPYVEIGDIIKPGQVVCIVEAMKLMNEIESDVAGRVTQILVKNEDPVEYNQELMLIEPL